MGDVDNRGGRVCAGVSGLWEIFVFFCLFFYKFIIVLIESFKNN